MSGAGLHQHMTLTGVTFQDRQHAQGSASRGSIRPVMVVLAPIVLNDDAGFAQGPKLLPVEALVAQASMETLDEVVLPRPAGLDIDRLDLIGGLPGYQSPKRFAATTQSAPSPASVAKDGQTKANNITNK